MTTFALIHGAWSLPQEWDRVAVLLRKAGHQAVAIDLPITDPRAGLAEYADTVVAALAHVREPVVIVAHSAGGHAAALVPSRRPVRQIVYLTAFVPVPRTPFLIRSDGKPLSEARGDVQLAHPDFRGVMLDRGDGTCALDPHALAQFLVGDLAREGVATLLASMLRPHGLRAFEEPFPLASLPDVPSSYLLCAADMVIPPTSQRTFAARLGVTPIELPGVDHGAHMKRPRLVAEAILSAT